MGKIHNPDFNVTEFRNIKNQSGSNGFVSDLDVPLKMERLKQWCIDINKAQSGIKYDYVFVDEESFEVLCYEK